MRQSKVLSGVLVPSASFVLTFVCVSSTTAQQLPPTVSLVDSGYVRIGTVDGPPETAFAGIVSAVRLPGGNIAVADGGGHVVRFFDASGEHLRSFGREGSGPNEFDVLWWLGVCPEGELLAVDAAMSRGIFLSATSGRPLRTVRLPANIRFNRYLSCEGDGNVIVLLDRPQAIGSRGQVSQFPAAVIRASLDSASQDTLALLAGTDYYFGMQAAGYSAVPLGAQAMASASPGRIYAAQSNDAVIHVIDLKTGSRSAFPHGLAASRLTTTGWESAKSEFVQRAPLDETRRLLEDVLAEMPAPDAYPAFVDMTADRAGRVWLRLPSTRPSVVWKILDPDGGHVGSVRLPSSIQPLDIGESHLVALDRDALDVQTIRVYSFSSTFLSFEHR